VDAGLARLREEVVGYGGYPPEDVERLIEARARPAAAARAAAADALLDGAEEFSRRRTAAWRHAAGGAGTWLAGVAGLAEEHRGRHERLEAGARAALTCGRRRASGGWLQGCAGLGLLPSCHQRTQHWPSPPDTAREARAQFDVAHAEREAAFAAALVAVGAAATERALDAAVEAALVRLGEIEGGYREFHAAATAAARDHPGRVRELEAWYASHLRPLLGVASPSGSGSGGGGGNGGAAAAALVVRLLEGYPPEQAPAGDAVAAAAAAAAGAQGDGQPDEAAATGAAGAPGAGQHTAPGPAAAAAAAAAGAGKAPRSPERQASRLGRPPKTEAAVAAAAAAAEAAEGAEAAKAAARAAAAEAAAREAAASTCPTASSGEQLCTEAPLATEAIEAAVASLRVRARCWVCVLLCISFRRDWHGSMRPRLHPCRSRPLQEALLSYSELFAARAEGVAAEWAEQQEAALTEELDSRLRAHRPRAGRVEEGDRLTRGGELAAQRQRVEAHMAEQSKAVKRQQVRRGGCAA
jgi:hypothetical protein